MIFILLSAFLFPFLSKSIALFAPANSGEPNLELVLFSRHIMAALGALIYQLISFFEEPTSNSSYISHFVHDLVSHALRSMLPGQQPHRRQQHTLPSSLMLQRQGQPDRRVTCKGKFDKFKPRDRHVQSSSDRASRSSLHPRLSVFLPIQTRTPNALSSSTLPATIYTAALSSSATRSSQTPVAPSTNRQRRRAQTALSTSKWGLGMPPSA